MREGRYRFGAAFLLSAAAAMAAWTGPAAGDAAASGAVEAVLVERAPPPRTLPAGIRAKLGREAVVVRLEEGKVARLWFARSIPASDVSATPLLRQRLNYAIRPGALVGAVELFAPWRDSKGQTIAAGVYLLHYAPQPLMKEHRAVSPYRDFLLLVPPSAPFPGARDLPALADASRRVSGTAHPAVMALVPSGSAGPLPRLAAAGEARTLEVRAGRLDLGLELRQEPKPESEAEAAY